MTNINIKNFITELPEIENSIKDAKLISIDLEFTALHPLKTPSLFDSPYERYSKLRINLTQVIPIQVGITTFTFNPNDRSYNGKMYNFYILPACFPTIQRSFYFQSDTLNFLKLHKFDFNEGNIFNKLLCFQNKSFRPYKFSLDDTICASSKYLCMISKC